MINQKVAQIAVDGKLPANAWPGLAPLYYINNHNQVLCPDCANDHADYDETIVDYAANEEDVFCQCDHCKRWIDPGLFSEEETQQARFEQIHADNMQRAADNLAYWHKESK